ncbi:uncharacterized protein LOC135468231 [Liolophura sinensis]|uniref:uncharacterized protein LOC135468231 n=1 Tax=Liolophura sinensis TaxID=3198878 RepID=UPI0031596B28
MPTEEVDPGCVKCVIVGDEGVGKTCMALSYANREFPEETESTIFDTYAVDLTVDDEPWTLGMFDTAGQEPYESLRAFAYAQCEVFIICFSVVKPDSLENVETVWMPEIKHYNKKRKPVILVGTQTDLREADHIPRDTIISQKEAEKMAELLGASCYLECSALSRDGLQHIFNETLLSAIDVRRKKKHNRLRVFVKRLSDTLKRKKTKG